MAKQNILKVEPGLINRICAQLSPAGVSGTFLFITDAQVGKLYGSAVVKQLQQFGCVKEEVVDDNTIAYSMKVAERVIATDVDYIVGLGGGRVLDVCKYAAYISKHLCISIPTTLSNDGVASAIAVLKRQDGMPKSLGCSMPSIILIDTDLIYKSPVNLLKAGIGDIISNYMALKDWKLACDRDNDSMNDFAYLMSHNSLDALIQTQYSSICPEFINVLANSLVLSGIAMEFCGSSRPVSGSEHLFSHALDYYCKTKNLHGIQVALGTVAMLKLLDMDYSDVLDYLRRFNVDVNPEHIGISQDDFVLCMQKAPTMRTNRYTYLNELELKDGTLKNLYNHLKEELK